MRRTRGRPGTLRRAFAVGVPLRWYALTLATPLAATALAVLVLGVPSGSLGSALVSGLLLQLVRTFVPNNWWEEVAWTGFAQARLQARFGSATRLRSSPDRCSSRRGSTSPSFSQTQ